MNDRYDRIIRAIETYGLMDEVAKAEILNDLKFLRDRHFKVRAQWIVMHEALERPVTVNVYYDGTKVENERPQV